MVSTFAGHDMVGSERQHEDSPELVSPELALVDSELADRARWRLRLEEEIGPGPAVSASAESAAAPPASAPVIRRPPHASRAPKTSRAPRRRSRVVRAAALAVLAFVMLGFAARALNPSDKIEPVRQPASAVPGVDGRPPGAQSRSAAGQQAPEPKVTKPKEKRKVPKRPVPPSRTAPAGSPAQARTFAWAPLRAARGYRVEFFRSGRRVFATRTTRPRLTLPARWTHAGRRYRLTAGEYRWYVWPLIRSRSGISRGKAIVQARLKIPA